MSAESNMALSRRVLDEGSHQANCFRLGGSAVAQPGGQ